MRRTAVTAPMQTKFLGKSTPKHDPWEFGEKKRVWSDLLGTCALVSRQPRGQVPSKSSLEVNANYSTIDKSCAS